ncbi:MAG: hypothetical protein LAT65_18385 [Saccharospirillum sp.]|nr:hypothetical protein [Saccharospirillum sp.]
MIALLTLILLVSLYSLSDALRFELIRTQQQHPRQSGTIALLRLAVLLPLGWFWAWVVTTWSQAGTLGLLMVTFTGSMIATWLWMMGWIRTYIADPSHPTRKTGIVEVSISTLLSFNTWLATFTLPALLVVFLGEQPLLILLLATSLFAIGDALLLALAGHNRWGATWIQSEVIQKRLSRIGGSVLVVVAIWAILDSLM